MPVSLWPDTEAPSGVALVNLARETIHQREIPRLTPTRNAIAAAIEVSPIFMEMQLRDAELATEESLTAALAAHQSGDRDRAILHLVAALESTARADALEQKETI